MKCIVLTAGHATKLEAEIRADQSGDFAHLSNKPKALLPGPDGRPLLDYWWEALTQTRKQFSDIFLVTNADKYKHYERWATAHGFPRENIINDGTTSGTGGIGALADFDLVLRSRKVEDDVLVVAGDMLFDPKSFDLDGVARFFQTSGGELACYYDMHSGEDPTTRGIVEVEGNRIVKFLEKPRPEETRSRQASVVLYCFRKETIPMVQSYLENHSSVPERTFGKFLEWLVPQTPIFGMKLPECFDLIGSGVGLEDYRAAIASKRQDASATVGGRPITRRAHARVGLMGNPSDGFNGKTISVSIENYWAEATIVQSERLVLQPHPLNDPSSFGSLADLYGISRQEGYQGGMRLMQATCKKFFEYCSEHGIAVARRNFTLSYDTNVPRQVGLAGSSAIVTACLKCLLAFFNLTEQDIPKADRPSFVLAIEMQELGINAGLQDRVIQIYDGCVYMDFDKELMDAQGHGKYEYIALDKLPRLWLGYLADPSDSGKIHSDVRMRYDNGDAEACEAMRQFAGFAEQAKGAIAGGDHAALADLMDANFALRRKVYGDPCVGEANLSMVRIAHKHGSAVKFPGSGGAVLGLCRDPARLRPLKADFEAAGYVFTEVIPHAAPESAS